jgi:hypothetical protein
VTSFVCESQQLQKENLRVYGKQRKNMKRQGKQEFFESCFNRFPQFWQSFHQYHFDFLQKLKSAFRFKLFICTFFKPQLHLISGVQYSGHENKHWLGSKLNDLIMITSDKNQRYNYERYSAEIGYFRGILTPVQSLVPLKRQMLSDIKLLRW